ncbi:MAG: hypothetical protein K2U26_14660 [Cyclobacteriaceae bacterium]|nr:hypothetical protein [Cyclobacteriaceae bacterium]
MYYFQLFILFLSLTCVLFLIIGLIKPWAMLWWEDTQNRMKVIMVYGSLAVVFGIAYIAMRLFS